MRELQRSQRAMVVMLCVMMLIGVGAGGMLLLVFEPQLARYTELTKDARLIHESMLDQETGLRGWLATGDAVFLETYRDGSDRSEQLAAGLLARGKGDAGVTENLVPLLVARERWQVWARSAAVWRVSASDRTGGELTRFLLQGKELFDRYRIDDARNTGYIVDQRDAASSSQQTTVVIGVSAVFLLLAGSAAGMLRRRRQLQTSVLGPMRQSLETIRRMADGDRSARMEPTGVSELDSVALALGTLADELDRADTLAAAREARLALLAERLDMRHPRRPRDLRQPQCPLRRRGRRLRGGRPARSSDDAVGAQRRRSVPGRRDAARIAMASYRRRTWSCRPSWRPSPPTRVRPETAPSGPTRWCWPAWSSRCSNAVDHRGRGRRAGARGTPVDRLRPRWSPRGCTAPHGSSPRSTRSPSCRTGAGWRATSSPSGSDAAATAGRSRFVMLDLDRFKRLNDSFGHVVGDTVLNTVAGAIRTALRSTDTAYRYGGEEMAVLLRETSLEEGLVVAERVRRAVEAVVVPDTTARVTASLGVAQLETTMVQQAELVSRADAALYEAKRGGRDRVVASAAAMQDRLTAGNAAYCAVAVWSRTSRIGVVSSVRQRLSVTSRSPRTTGSRVLSR